MSKNRYNTSSGNPLVSQNNNSIHLYASQNDELPNIHSSQQNYNYQYYEQYKKLYFTAYCLSLQLKKILKSKEQYCLKIQKLEKKAEEETRQQQKQQNPDRKKRLRRTAEQIQRKFYCNVQRCGRNYGSEGSLQQHIKLKHPELYAQRVQENGYHHCSDIQQQSF